MIHCVECFLKIKIEPKNVFSTVKNAIRLPVYVDTIITTAIKKDAATRRPDVETGIFSRPKRLTALV